MESPISIETVGKIGKEPCSGCDHQAHLAVLYKKDSRIFVQHQSLLPLWRRFFSQIVVVGNLPVDTSTNLLVSGTTRCYCVHNNYPYIRIFKYEYIYIHKCRAYADLHPNFPFQAFPSKDIPLRWFDASVAPFVLELGCVAGDPLEGEGQMPGSQKSWEKSFLVHGVTWRPGCSCGALAADFACGGCGQAAGNGQHLAG